MRGRRNSHRPTSPYNHRLIFSILFTRNIQGCSTPILDCLVFHEIMQFSETLHVLPLSQHLQDPGPKCRVPKRHRTATFHSLRDSLPTVSHAGATTSTRRCSQPPYMTDKSIVNVAMLCKIRSLLRFLIALHTTQSLSVNLPPTWSSHC